MSRYSGYDILGISGMSRSSMEMAELKIQNLRKKHPTFYAQNLLTGHGTLDRLSYK
jgi:hypothetical protein